MMWTMSTGHSSQYITFKTYLGSLLFIWVKIDKEEWHFIQVSERKKKVSDEGNTEIIAKIRAKMCKFSGFEFDKSFNGPTFLEESEKVYILSFNF